MSILDQVTTAEQLLHTPGLGRCELVRGEVIAMSPAGGEHGWIAASVAAPLTTYVKQNKLGRVFGAETGFHIASDPDTVRAPDAAFVSKDRLSIMSAKGFVHGAPDLAVEVLSPDDRAGEILAKVQEWLDAGCRAVWVVDPRTRTVTVYRSRSEIAVLGQSETLSGEDFLPGFAMRVAEIFED